MTSSSELLPAETSMGAVTLWVADLDDMVRYYRDGIGLEVLSESESSAILGASNTPIVILESKPGMKHASPHEAGLFNTAILFPTQAALAKAVYSVATKYPGTFTGSADHLVSQAFFSRNISREKMLMQTRLSDTLISPSDRFRQPKSSTSRCLDLNRR